MDTKHNKYIPALGYGWLTALYDWLIRLTLRELTFKRHLVEQARIEPGHRVLDLGCGTATLTLLIKRLYPEAFVVGIDGDAKILKIAKEKAYKAGLGVTLVRGMSFELPFSDDAFDRVLSGLLFHHLTRENKIWTFREILRVLRPGGELHLADWGQPQNQLIRAAFLVIQMLDGFTTTADNVKGLLPELFAATGFEEVRQPARYTTPFGTISLLSAKKPE